MSDLDIKKAVLEDGLDKQYNRARKRAFFGDESDMEELKATYGLAVIRVCRNLSRSEYQRAKRVLARIKPWIDSGRAVFFTLTFTDETLSKTNGKTRRRYVSRLLSRNCERYLANIDFGSDNHREHYHAIATLSDDVKIEMRPITGARGKRAYVAHALIGGQWLPLSDCLGFTKWTNSIGFLNAQIIGNSESDAKATAKYTAKMSNHALKESTRESGNGRAPRLIYSRRKTPQV